MDAAADYSGASTKWVDKSALDRIISARSERQIAQIIANGAKWKDNAAVNNDKNELGVSAPTEDPAGTRQPWTGWEWVTPTVVKTDLDKIMEATSQAQIADIVGTSRRQVRERSEGMPKKRLKRRKTCSETDVIVVD